jgi:hypothetical protein
VKAAQSLKICSPLHQPDPSDVDLSGYTWREILNATGERVPPGGPSMLLSAPGSGADAAIEQATIRQQRSRILLDSKILEGDRDSSRSVPCNPLHAALS